MASRTARKNGNFLNGLLTYKVTNHFFDYWALLDNPSRLGQIPSSLDAWLLADSFGKVATIKHVFNFSVYLNFVFKKLTNFHKLTILDIPSTSLISSSAYST
jgi:hypothetical protein